MAGLLNKAPHGAPQPGMGQGGMMQEQAAPMEGEEQSNVSPEDQREYNEFVSNGMTLMYDEKAMPQLIQTIEGDGNPIEGLGNALAMIVMRLEDSAEDQRREISADVKFHGAAELLEHMAELAQEAGVHEFSEEEIETAFYLGLDVYRSTRQQQGKLSEEELGQDMQELMAAEQAGTLDQVLPGISEYAERAPRPEDVQGGQGG